MNVEIINNYNISILCISLYTFFNISFISYTSFVIIKYRKILNSFEKIPLITLSISISIFTILNIHHVITFIDIIKVITINFSLELLSHMFIVLSCGYIVYYFHVMLKNGCNLAKRVYQMERRAEDLMENIENKK